MSARIDSLPVRSPARHFEQVWLLMTSEDRRRVHRRVTAPDGRELILNLPTGTVLKVGQLLHHAEARDYIIGAAPEDVLLISPKDWKEGAFVGHLIGNLHRDIDLVGDGVAVIWDAPLERRLKKAGLSYKRAMLPFHGKPAGEHSH